MAAIRYGVPRGSDLGLRFLPFTPDHGQTMTFPCIICWRHTDLFTSLVLPVPSGLSLECQNLFFFSPQIKNKTKRFLRIWLSIQPCFFRTLCSSFSFNCSHLGCEHQGMTVNKARCHKHQLTLDLCVNHLCVWVTVSAEESSAVFCAILITLFKMRFPVDIN